MFSINSLENLSPYSSSIMYAKHSMTEETPYIKCSSPFLASYLPTNKLHFLSSSKIFLSVAFSSFVNSLMFVYLSFCNNNTTLLGFCLLVNIHKNRMENLLKLPTSGNSAGLQWNDRKPAEQTIERVSFLILARKLNRDLTIT